MTNCLRCLSYECAGHRPPPDCGHREEIASRHAADDHRFCQPNTDCAWAEHTRPLVLAAGLGRGSPDRPLALVLVSPQTGRVLFAGQTFRDHRDGKPGRTAAGGGGWAAKRVAFLVCSRYRLLH
jgi:hypothetical protein